MKKTYHSSEHLTADQMEKYTNGLMNSTDSHQVEKHLLDCELCSEAMEGLESFVGKGGFQTDVNLLKHRIDQRVAVSSAKPVPYREIGIAASIILLLGSAVYIFSVQYFDDNDRKIAKNQDSEKEIQKRGPEERDHAAIGDSTVKEVSGVRDYEKELPDLTGPVLEEEKSPKEAGEILKAEQEIQALERLERPAIPDEVRNIENDQPLEENNETPFVSPSEGTGENQVEEGKDLANVEFKEDKSKVYHNATKKKARIQAAPPISTAGAKPEAIMQIASQGDAHPTGGMEEFKKYVKKNLDYPREARENEINGKVVLSFRVDENGGLSEIHIEKGLGYGCDEEAVRLLKEGPRWEPAVEGGLSVSSKNSIEIEFGK